MELGDLSVLKMYIASIYLLSIKCVGAILLLIGNGSLNKIHSIFRQRSTYNLSSTAVCGAKHKSYNSKTHLTITKASKDIRLYTHTQKPKLAYT